MKSMVAQLTSIEGKASDVRQARTTIMSSGGAWGASYECLFRLSDMPVALRVSGPIFIEEGETVKVFGIQNLHGVFDAVAYCNQSSGVSGHSDQLFASTFWAEMLFLLGVITLVAALVAALIEALFFPEAFSYTKPLFISFVLIGLPLVFIGWKMYLRSRSHLQRIERLFYDA